MLAQMQKRPEGRSFTHLTSPAPITALPIERITECQSGYHLYSTTFVLTRQMKRGGGRGHIEGPEWAWEFVGRLWWRG